jgi:hypothetical protein
MQDNLPDLPASVSPPAMQAGLPESKPSIFSRLKSAGSDDKRVVKIILIVGFVFLVILGLLASVLERVAPRGGKQPSGEEQFSSGLWQIQPQPNQILLGFYTDTNKNGVYDYAESVFNQVSVSIRKAGETEPFRSVPAGVDGAVKIDDLTQGEYEISLDNYSRPDAATSAWLWFDDYQLGEEFLPTKWRPVSLKSEGYKELIGITPYQPKLVLTLATENGVSWYDPERAREIGKNNQELDHPVVRGNDLFFISDSKLKRLDWRYRTESEQLIWLDEAKDWLLSPEGKTVAYLSEGSELAWRSADESCPEGNLLFEGTRLKVKSYSFIGETSWLIISQGDEENPVGIYRVDCRKVEPLTAVGEPVGVGSLGAGDWFYSTTDATYLVDNSSGKAVKYTALGGGEGIGVSQDKRYLMKKISAGSWLIVDYPAVKTSGVEKHYLITGYTAEPALVGDNAYFVKAKSCEADGDCGEIVRIKLEGSSTWLVSDTWDLKNVAATKVLGVID